MKHEGIYFILAAYERKALKAQMRGDHETVKICTQMINELKSKYNL